MRGMPRPIRLAARRVTEAPSLSGATAAPIALSVSPGWSALRWAARVEADPFELVRLRPALDVLLRVEAAGVAALRGLAGLRLLLRRCGRLCGRLVMTSGSTPGPPAGGAAGVVACEAVGIDDGEAGDDGDSGETAGE